VMGDDEGTQSIFGGDAAGIANHVRVAGLEAEAVLEQDAGVHAGKKGHVPPRTDRKLSQREIAGKFFVGLQEFVSYGQIALLRLAENPDFEYPTRLLHLVYPLQSARDSRCEH
jgi:hypothetical protein